MQFMPDTARRYGLRDPHDAGAAIDAAAHYLRDLLVRFSGRLDLPLAAYNAGEGTVESFLTGRPLRLTSGKIINPRGLITGGLPPYTETRAYVNSIIGLSLESAGQVPKGSLVSLVKNTKPRRSMNRNFGLSAPRDTNQTPRPASNVNSSFIEVQ